MMKLVEEIGGAGELMHSGQILRRVTYHVRRYQEVMEGSGLPIPGLHRIEGTIDFDEKKDPNDWIGISLSLKLADGRVLGITLVSPDGRILNEGHGPSKCLCC